jgi:D-alanyl-lipoteichoic acid acyltransferase DltB (MBOAT superfamily)
MIAIITASHTWATKAVFPLLLAESLEISFGLEGWLHLMVDGRDVIRGPLGIVLYVLFAPGYWLMPASQRCTYLIGTSLLLAVATVGVAYTLNFVLLALFAWVLVRLTARPDRLRTGTILLALVGLAFLLYPQPPWLPQLVLPEPHHFYWHWAGFGYLFLRTYHVMADVSAGRLKGVTPQRFFTYLLFAPTLRMGPIYRFQEFAQQLHDGPKHYRRFGGAAVRLLTGMLRLGIMAVTLDELQIDYMFEHPETFPLYKLLLAVYLGPLCFYLWFSGYIDISIAVGRVLGFEVPDNFNYPWRSINIGEFWTRWHITLSDWLRDYLFKPLVRKRFTIFSSYLFTFAFCGMWHGVVFGYVFWGVSQGVGLAVRRYWMEYWKRQKRSSTRLYTTLHRLRLVESPLNTAAAWLLTFNYICITIFIPMDFKYTNILVFREIFNRLLAD